MALKFPNMFSRYGAASTINDLILPANPITASSTVTYNFGAYFRKRYVERLSIGAQIVPAGGAALTATVRKVSGGVSTPLTAAFDLTSLSANVVKQIPLLTTLTDPNRIVLEGDVLVVDIIAAGTVTTNATQLSLTAESDVLA